MSLRDIKLLRSDCIKCKCKIFENGNTVQLVNMIECCLLIQSIDIVEQLVAQKCHLPQCYFKQNTNLIPGAYIKCTTNKACAYICQVYARNLPNNLCYLDNTVSTVSNEQQHGAYLQKLELLQPCKKRISEVQLTFVLNEDCFANEQTLHKRDQQWLLHVAQPLLQTLQLTNNCCIAHKELLQHGIVRLEVSADCKQHEYFSCDYNTRLLIVDVQLPIAGAAAGTLLSSVFAPVETELQTLLQQLDRKAQLLQCFVALNALLTGATGVGKSTVALHFLKGNKCNVFKICAAAVLGQYPGETQAALSRIFKACKHFVQQFKPKLKTCIFIEQLHLLCGHSTNATTERVCDHLLSLIDELHMQRLGIICLATTNEATALSAQACRAARFEREVHIPLPTAAQRQQLFADMWQTEFNGKLTLNAELLKEISQQTRGYVAADLELLMRNLSQQYARDQTFSFDMSAALRNALQQIQPNSLRATEVNVYQMTEGFERIAGMQQLKRQLQASVLAGLQNLQLYKRFGLQLPKGVLLYGPPGCAKTSIAKCLAAEAHMTFIATSGAEVYSPYVGCAERFIAKLFDTARKNAPCMIFMDEIDTLVGRRTLSNAGAGEVQVRILSTLLTEMDGILSGSNNKMQILVVAATNRPDMIDDALLRPGRFDKLIHVPAPDVDTRLSILQMLAQRMPFAADIELRAIALVTHNYSGADLCNLCNEAALQAMQRDMNAMEIRMQDFNYMLEILKPSLNQQQIDWYSRFEQGILTKK